MNVHLVSLGCARNLVDSEMMLGLLLAQGFTITQDPREAEIVVVNTCSFIRSAVDESIDTILSLSKLKKEAACKRLIVTGCLPERYRQKIMEALPEVDAFLGTGAFDKIAAAAKGDLQTPENHCSCILPDPDQKRVQAAPGDHRVRSTPHMAYLKIAEGCSRHCTYCMIPKLRGKQQSRPVDAIAAEARALIDAGVKELVLIAQDTTAYGTDLMPPQNLQELLVRLADLDEGVWLRILYGHPESLDESVIETVSERPNICSYFDIPIQHAASRILKKMGRNYATDDLYRLFDRIRERIPDVSLRTTVMVGFPGETDGDIETLLTFIKRVRFDHLGGFVYSDDKTLPSHALDKHVSADLARVRFDRVMELQNRISLQKNRSHIGRCYVVLVEQARKKGLFAGRSAFQAPEVDGITYIHARHLQPGCFTKVRIVDAKAYDLFGEPI